MVRRAVEADRPWIGEFLGRNFSTRVARRGELLTPMDHAMLLAERDGKPAGLLTYIVGGEGWEVLTLHTESQWGGVGTALIEAVARLARDAGARHLWLITTNDNVDALRFYQRRGFRIRTIRPGAVDDSRHILKPDIPTQGEYGIPIRDEIELERAL